MAHYSSYLESPQIKTQGNNTPRHAAAARQSYLETVIDSVMQSKDFDEGLIRQGGVISPATRQFDYKILQ